MASDLRHHVARPSVLPCETPLSLELMVDTVPVPVFLVTGVAHYTLNTPCLSSLTYVAIEISLEMDIMRTPITHEDLY